jgi:hypothetical protein
MKFLEKTLEKGKRRYVSKNDVSIGTLWGQCNLCIVWYRKLNSLIRNDPLSFLSIISSLTKLHKSIIILKIFRNKKRLTCNYNL